MWNGLKVNSYDPYVANQTVSNKQHKVVWHVDNPKSSNANSKVNDNFLKWLEKMYEDEKVAQVNSSLERFKIILQ
jgi:hypothetical protein